MPKKREILEVMKRNRKGIKNSCGFILERNIGNVPQGKINGFDNDKEEHQSYA